MTYNVFPPFPNGTYVCAYMLFSHWHPLQSTSIVLHGNPCRHLLFCLHLLIAFTSNRLRGSDEFVKPVSGQSSIMLVTPPFVEKLHEVTHQKHSQSMMLIESISDKILDRNQVSFNH